MICHMYYFLYIISIIFFILTLSFLFNFLHVFSSFNASKIFLNCVYIEYPFTYHFENGSFDTLGNVLSFAFFFITIYFFMNFKIFSVLNSPFIIS